MPFDNVDAYRFEGSIDLPTLFQSQFIGGLPGDQSHQQEATIYSNAADRPIEYRPVYEPGQRVAGAAG